MTHTKYFKRIAHGLDVEPLLELLDARPELWDEITTRQTFTKSPHKDTKTIYVRGALKMSPYYVLYDIGAYDYPIMEYLKSALVPLMKPILDKLQVKELGRVLIVNLKSTSQVTRHIDQGTYADHYERFHIVLRSNQHCFLTSGNWVLNLEVGEVWWFNNKVLHSAENNGDSDRWHIIFDAVISEELQ